MTPVIKVSGVSEVQRALEFFSKNMKNGAQRGVRTAGSFVAASLAKRTRKPHGRGAYPAFRLATEADADALAPHLPNNTGWSEGRFRGYIRWLAGRAYVALADHPMPHGLPYRHLAMWDREEYALSDLKARYRYRNAGLAKKAWRWIGKAARAKSSSTGMGGLANVVQQGGNRPAVTLVDRLRYSRTALDGDSAIEDALRAAGRRLVGMVQADMRRRAERAMK